jgi:RNA polymerase sigma factor (sigma-70 family)
MQHSCDLGAMETTAFTTAELLERFLNRHEQGAFEELVRRHGPTVLAVCRRVVGHEQDAEDAYQAAFLVLAQKATKIRPPAMLPNWLYGVAYRVSIKLRALNAKRQAREKLVSNIPESRSTMTHLEPDLKNVVDEELSRLTDKYRVAVIMCDLEGMTYREAARQLGWPEGTLSIRLARARKKLAGRLLRRGITVSMTAVGAALSQNAATAQVPVSLFAGTIKAGSLREIGQAARAGIVSEKAGALAESTLKAMLVRTVKTWTAGLILLISIGFFVGFLATSTGQLKKLNGAQQAQDVKKDLEALQGTWRVVEAYRAGQPAKLDAAHDRALFKGDLQILDPGGADRTSRFALDPSKHPKWIDFATMPAKGKGINVPAIYELQGDTLRICFDNESDTPKRPSEFSSTPQNQLTLEVLRRMK